MAVENVWKGPWASKCADQLDRDAGWHRPRVAISWGAAIDDVGVIGYQVHSNGSLLATVVGLDFTTKASRGTDSYYVVAFDAAGNVSAPSNTAVITL